MEYIKLPETKISNVTINEAEVTNSAKLMNAESLWNKGYTGYGVTIAVIDTGCDIDHPDLKTQIIGYANFTRDDNSNQNIVTDYVGHGTHCAGIIAGAINGSGVCGIAPDSKLVIVKALSKNGGTIPDIVKGIDYAISKKVNIISMSLGGASYNKELHEAIKRAVDNNILCVVANGNNGDGRTETVEMNYPAYFEEVVAVAACDESKNVCKFSANNYHTELVCLGKDVLSTLPCGKYGKMTGTSMACPGVAGAAALLINKFTTEFKRTPSEAELYAQIIKNTIDLGYDKSIQGNGLLYFI